MTPDDPQLPPLPSVPDGPFFDDHTRQCANSREAQVSKEAFLAAQELLRRKEEEFEAAGGWERMANGGPASLLAAYADIAFPHDAFPPIVARFIAESAASVCVHPDMLAAMVLPVLATVIGSSRVLGVKEDWIEAPRLWVAVVADPGGKKSPAQKRAMAGLEVVQRELDQRFESEQEQWEHTEKRDRDPRDEPVLRQVVADDVTIEVLARMLQRHPRGILLDKDELSSWVKSFGEYKAGRGADRDRWLSLWNGKTLRVNRVNLGNAALVVPRPIVSIVGSIQPERVTSLIDKAGDDGLVYRLLFCAPSEVPESARTPSVSQDVRDAWQHICRSLYRLAADHDGTPRAVRCTLPGKEFLLDQLDRVYAEKRAPEMPPNVRGFWGKADAHLLRLACVLGPLWAVCEDVGEEVGTEVAEKAAAVNDYFKSQALRLFGDGGIVAPTEYERIGPALEGKVLAWMQNGHEKTTRRELTSNGPLKRTSTKEADVLLASLAARGQVEVSDGDRGRVHIHLRT